ncbi:MAG: bifunctional pyr operon transcriptional regulator/uracil phosphoribosyltransferase PyrR [Acidimicrobiales bacterium]|nr:bifunctional pyr operon transcriptional regulator/uracil phosphoribosyltransferase PyrR [Acidimicrobiales bacterium]
MESDGLRRAVTRISHEILERNDGPKDLIILGLANGGISIGQQIASNLSQIENLEVPFGVLDVSSYRDDLNVKEISFIGYEVIAVPSLDGKKVVLVDDVLYTGRTVKASFNALSEMGRPNSIQLAVMVDRGHREVPIRPDYVGKNLPTSKAEKVVVRDDGIYLAKGL